MPLEWQLRLPKLGIPRLTAGTIRIDVLSFLENLEITSWTTLLCTFSTQAAGTEQVFRKHLNTDLHHNQQKVFIDCCSFHFLASRKLVCDIFILGLEILKTIDVRRSACVYLLEED